MDRKKDPDKEKERLRLWVEYLKESETYRKAYECIVKKQSCMDDRESAEFIQRHKSEISKSSKRGQKLEKQDLKSIYPEKINLMHCPIVKSGKNMRAPLTVCPKWCPYGDNYSLARNMRIYEKRFGDIFSPQFSFEDWYEKNASKNSSKLVPHISISKLDVSGLSNKLSDAILDAKRSSAENNRELTFEDLRNSASKKWNELHENSVVFSIPLLVPLEMLKEDFVNLVKLYKRKRRITKAMEYEYTYGKDSQERFRDEVETYLKVYRLRKAGYTWREVVKELKPNDLDPEGKLPENVRRQYQTFHKKALKIIQNLETGEFPGKY